MSPGPTILFVEHVVWQPGSVWAELVGALADRFARSAPLDATAVLAAGALHEQLELLDAWAGDAGVDLDRELGRWLDEHLAMRMRPDPAVTRAVRSRASRQQLHAASALPPRAAESIARHAGCWRSFSQLHANLRDAAALGSLMRDLSAGAVVACPPTPLPATAALVELA